MAAMFRIVYISEGLAGVKNKKEAGRMALPLLKSLVLKMCLELPPGHAGQANQAQTEKQHRHRLGNRLQGDRSINSH